MPEVQMYTKDLVRNLQVDIGARVAIMRKGGLVRLTDYTGPGGVPPTLVLGLYWDVTDGVEIDLDASAVLLDADAACACDRARAAALARRAGFAGVAATLDADSRLGLITFDNVAELVLPSANVDKDHVTVLSLNPKNLVMLLLWITRF